MVLLNKRIFKRTAKYSSGITGYLLDEMDWLQNTISKDGNETAIIRQRFKENKDLSLTFDNINNTDCNTIGKKNMMFGIIKLEIEKIQNNDFNKTIYEEYNYENGRHTERFDIKQHEMYSLSEVKWDIDETKIDYVELNINNSIVDKCYQKHFKTIRHIHNIDKSMPPIYFLKKKIPHLFFCIIRLIVKIKDGETANIKLNCKYEKMDQTMYNGNFIDIVYDFVKMKKTNDNQYYCGYHNLQQIILPLNVTNILKMEVYFDHKSTSWIKIFIDKSYDIDDVSIFSLNLYNSGKGGMDLYYFKFKFYDDNDKEIKTDIYYTRMRLSNINNGCFSYLYAI